MGNTTMGADNDFSKLMPKWGKNLLTKDDIGAIL